MAAVQGRLAGYIPELFYDPAGTAFGNTTPTEAEVVAVAAAANSVLDVTSMDAIDSSRNIIDLPLYNQDRAGQLPGQINGSSFVFSVVLNLDNATHTALRDDDGVSPYPFVLKYEQTTDNITYVAFDGYVGGYSVTQPIDGALTMEITVPIAADVHWVDAA